MKKLLIILLFAVVIITLGFYLSLRKKPKDFTIAFNTWVGYGPFYIAKEMGFFKKEGLDVKLVRIEGTGERRAALMAKRIEALGSTIDDFVVGLSEGLNGKMVMVVDESFGADGIVAKENIKSISQFRGKRIAVQPGFVNHFFLLYLLDKIGMTQNEIIISPLEPDKAASALLNKEVDVAVTWEPHLSVIKNEKGFRLILTTTNSIAQHLIVDNFVVRNDVLKNRSEEVRKIMKCWFEAVDFLKNNQQEGDEIIKKAFGLKSPAEVREMLKGVVFPSLQQNLTLFNTNTHPNVSEKAEKALKLYQQEGIIENADRVYPLEKKIDASYIRSLE